jgi:hypothetical protein
MSYLYCNIPSSPAYGVYVLQLTRHARAYSFYDQFLYQGRLLTHELMWQGFLQFCLKSAFCKLYGGYNYLVLKVQPRIELNVAWCVSYYLLVCFNILMLTTDYSVFLIWTYGSRRVKLFNRGCLLLLGTWSHLWFVQGSVLAQSSEFVFHTWFMIYETDHSSLYYPFMKYIRH